MVTAVPACFVWEPGRHGDADSGTKNAERLQRLLEEPPGRRRLHGNKHRSPAKKETLLQRGVQGPETWTCDIHRVIQT
ncbi:uncharacterized protein V6R79_003787 [Siganus canaliculatus]